MADINTQLPSLPAAASTLAGDLYHVRQGATDKKIAVELLRDYILGELTAAEILALLLTVDGSGSLFDADKLDGQEGSYYRNASNLNSGSIPAGRLVAADLLAALLTVDGTSSLLDSDKLDGQEGSYYRNASNLNAGTVPDARLPTASTSDNGIVQLTTSTSSTSQVLAPTASALKQVNDDAKNASNLSSGTVPSARLPQATTSVLGGAEAATQTETDNGVDPNRFVSPATLANWAKNNTVSAATNGWWKDNTTGIIVQWGITSTIDNDSDAYVNSPTNYPITFPNNCFIVTGSITGSGGPSTDPYLAIRKDPTSPRTVFEYRTNALSGSNQITFFAIGN